MDRKTNDQLEQALLERLAVMGGCCHAPEQLSAAIKCSDARLRKLCLEMQQAGLVRLDEEVTRFGLTLAGKPLLKLDTSVWPVTPDELLILRCCRRGRLNSHQIHPRVPVNQRQRLLGQLAQKRLIKVYQTTIVGIELIAPQTKNTSR